jgi:hypothetical protein
VQAGADRKGCHAAGDVLWDRLVRGPPRRGRGRHRRPPGDDAAGFAQLLELLAEAGDRPEMPIPVAIETARGLLVACLGATGRPV